MTLRAHSTVLFSLLFFLLPFAGQPALSTPPVSAERHHTQVRLVADVGWVSPGSSFSVGLLMTMDPGWHTYWKNSGDAGLPTQVTWTLPKGIAAGEILWPLPHKYVEEGDVLVYGYETENMLVIPMTAASDLKPGTRVIIRADAEWLECEEVCIPGSGSDQITLVVRSGTPVPDNVELFSHYRKLLPSPSQASGLSYAVAATHRALEITLRSSTGSRIEITRDGLPDFYPEAFDEIQTGRTEVRSVDGGVLLRIPLSLHERGVAPPAFRGILVYRSESGDRHSSPVEVPLTPAFLSTLPVVGQGTFEELLDRTFAIHQSGGGDQPLWLCIVFALVGGLLLNIMPCVLPVIGLKIFALIRLGGEDPRRVKRLGLLFSSGILASFLALGLFVILLKSAGEQVGWGFQFQEPLFVIALGAVVLVFGLNLFGVFEIRLPGSAVSGAGAVVQKAGAGGNTSVGSFAEGVFATILATPCTAPVLGTALGFAFAQPAGIILIVFTAVAAGMALPYLVLTMKPSWMKLLPKPGEWMVTAKQFMGFLMLATLVWLLYILGKQLGVESVIWTSAFLLAVGLACWVIGRFATLTASRPAYAAAWGVSLVVCILGYWLFLQPVIEARDILSDGSSRSVENSLSESGEILWEAFSLSTLDRHLNQGKPVFIDFTAEWCLTCKVNERIILSNDDVIAKFKSSGIIAMKADWTSRNPDITRLLAKFGRSGVPLYVVFPEGKPNEPIVLPEVITSGMVIEAIGKAAGE